MHIFKMATCNAMQYKSEEVPDVSNIALLRLNAVIENVMQRPSNEPQRNVRHEPTLLSTTSC